MAKFRPIRAGTLRDEVQITTLTRTYSATGDEIQTASTDATKHRAHVEPIQGSEHMAAMQLTPDLTHVVTMRDVSGLTSANRLLLNTSRVLEIVSRIDTELRGREIILLCKELL